MIKRYCDCCMKIIRDGLGRTFDLPLPYEEAEIAIDICDDCLEKLWDGRLDKPIDKKPLKTF